MFDESRTETADRVARGTRPTCKYNLGRLLCLFVFVPGVPLVLTLTLFTSICSGIASLARSAFSATSPAGRHDDFLPPSCSLLFRFAFCFLM